MFILLFPTPLDHFHFHACNSQTEIVTSAETASKVFKGRAQSIFRLLSLEAALNCRLLSLEAALNSVRSVKLLPEDQMESISPTKGEYLKKTNKMDQNSETNIHRYIYVGWFQDFDLFLLNTAGKQKAEREYQFCTNISVSDKI